MISYDMRLDDGILVVHPEDPLEASDFVNLAMRVDTYLAQHGKLLGVLITARSFPGWKNFSALLAHLKFAKEHHRMINKVAVVADGAIANILPNIAGHFLQAELRHFDLGQEDAAWVWLRQPIRMPQHMAA